MKKPKQRLYQKIAQTADAYHRCVEKNNGQWADTHRSSLVYMEKVNLPSGSGIDNGCKINIDASNEKRIVIHSEYHAMNDVGYYDGWYSFKVVVKPHLFLDFELRITGNFGKCSDVKDHLYEVFRNALMEEVDY